MLSISFERERGGKTQMVPILAKRARGLMAYVIISRQIREPDSLRDFAEDGYRFIPARSTDDQWVDVRRG